MNLYLAVFISQSSGDSFPQRVRPKGCCQRGKGFRQRLEGDDSSAIPCRSKLMSVLTPVRPHIQDQIDAKLGELLALTAGSVSA